jgi:hypothetical protein
MSIDELVFLFEAVIATPSGLFRATMGRLPYRDINISYSLQHLTRKLRTG